MTQVASKPTTKQWTKELVQEHAQTAVKVELYTLPFYLTALASIKLEKDKDGKPIRTEIYKSLLSICIEEMLHLQLAANLCIALDTQPIFIAPKYGVSIPYLDPDNKDTGYNNLINAELSAFDDKTLDMMLDIETPNGLEKHRHPEEGIIRKFIDWVERVEHSLEHRWNMDYHSTPKYPYSSIGEMYDALITGIKKVGEDQFSWKTTNQQKVWDKEEFKQIITSFEDAENAVKTISLQGEGTSSGEEKFMVPPHYRLENEPDDAYDLDAHHLNEYSHYERLLIIKKQGIPDDCVYGLKNDEKSKQEQQKALQELQCNFAKLLSEMNSIWNMDEITPNNSNFWQTMYTDLLPSLTNCWKSGVVPNWTP